MKKLFTFLSFLLLVILGMRAQNYNELDKAALRKFLLQRASPIMSEGDKGDLNLIRLRLSYMDTIDWTTSEIWVTKISGITWNAESPKRLTEIEWEARNVSGRLDLSNCSALKRLSCGLNHLSGELNVNGLENLTDLDCDRNIVTALNLGGCVALENLDCSGNIIKKLDISDLISLKKLNCTENQLLFSGIPFNIGLLENYEYAPQKTITLLYYVHYSDTIDLTKEHYVGGYYTDFKWIDEKPISISTNDSAKFSFDTSYIGKTVMSQIR